MKDGSVWSDDPVLSVVGDQLGRGHVARQVAKLLVDAQSWDSSLVFALTGPWGSGKTSLLEMICETLVLGHSNWSTARFTPWASSDVEGLLSEFYASLASALPEDRGKRARDALAVCAKVVGPALKMIPYAGEALAQGAQVSAEALSRRVPWQQAFDEAAQGLRDANRPVLVIVDDLDRLQRDELLAVLKVVRLLGRFPGVNYLLAYDEQTLFATLRGDQSSADGLQRARRFMEKIVQYPVAVPPMLPTQIISRLDEGLTRLTVDLERPLESGDGRLSQLQETFERQLTTPRAIDRFLAQVRLALSQHEPDEIDDVDLILMALIRVQFPDLYASLPRWRRSLTRTWSAWQRSTGRDKEPDWTRLYSLAGGDDDQSDARDVLEIVFPAAAKQATNSAPRRASNPEYFSRYVVNTVPDEDVSDSLIVTALRDAQEHGEGQTLVRELLTSKYPGRSDLALNKLIRASSSSAGEFRTDGRATLPLLSAVMSVLTELTGGHASFFSQQERGIHWAADIMAQLPSDCNSADLATSLHSCDDLGIRLSVVWSMKSEPPSDAVKAVARGLADEALESLLENLREKDEADVTSPTLFQMIFIQRHGSVQQARDAIQAGLGDAYFLEDFAARCISIAYSMSRTLIQKIGEFDQGVFAAFAPADDPLYGESVNNGLDLYDVTWPNRRAYARGRAVGSPPQAGAATERGGTPDPSAGAAG